MLEFVIKSREHACHFSKNCTESKVKIIVHALSERNIPILESIRLEHLREMELHACLGGGGEQR